MANNPKDRQKMPEQPPLERAGNFKEVALGYTDELAAIEAARCLQCKNAPCVAGCPVDIDIPKFIRLMRGKDYGGSLAALREKNNLPAICGRVCPQETQCEKACVLSRAAKPIAIGRLERFVADRGGLSNNSSVKNAQTAAKSQNVAVIGSGPAGLTVAADLARMGYPVTIFEALHEAGGVLTYGIPEFRLPKRIVKAEVEYVKSLGVKLDLDMVIGKILTTEELFKDFDAIFIGTGAGTPHFMGIPGENLNGVFSANEFLTRSNLMRAYLFPEYDTPIKIGKKVAVIGGGNVAMDAARTALRLGKGQSEVTIVYRRTENEMPARAEEREHAKEEGIRFMTLTAPLRILGTDDDGWVKRLECAKMELGEPDSSGRRRPVQLKGSEFLLDVDTVIVAIGQGPNVILKVDGLKRDDKSYVIVDSDGRTSIPGIFAGGDITPSDATVINAMGAGKKAALTIDSFLRGKPQSRK